MPPAPVPSEESRRLAKLRSLGVLDTEAEDRFDRIALLASEITGMPIAAISLVDEDRQFFKSICGLEVRETPRDVAFCAYTILSEDPMVVTDAPNDPRFFDNALVTGPPRIRAYAGVPLIVDGLCLGSLCVIDLEPRELTNAQISGLRTLAEVTSSELVNRVLRREAESAMKARTMFLANMNHEIRSPLSVISGYAELLSDPRTSADDAKEAIDSITQNANHLLQLVNSILDFSKIESDQFLIEEIAFRPDETIAQAVQMLAGSAEQSGISIRSEISDHASRPLIGDPTRVRQIAVNLIANAIKFSDGNDIEVQLHCDGAAHEDAKLALTVTDHGIGMDEDEMSRVFDEFQQADASSARRFGGTGLGLSVVRRLVSRMGGTIHVESSPGEGSTFTVEFRWPVADAASQPTTLGQPATTTGASGSGDELKGLRILLAEDGPDNQRLLSHFLRAAGAGVEVVPNGRDAWQRVTGDPASLDCLVMDVQMPVMDGAEAIRRIRKSGSDIPILMLTANTLSETKDECVRAGCDGYAFKPIRRAEFIERVATLVAGNQRSNAA